jgi:hypothetical protein
MQRGKIARQFLDDPADRSREPLEPHMRPVLVLARREAFRTALVWFTECLLLALFGPRAICGAGPRYPNKWTSPLIDRPHVRFSRSSPTATAFDALLAKRSAIIIGEIGDLPAANRPDGQITSDFPKWCQARKTEIFRFRDRANHRYKLGYPVPLRGASAIVANVGTGCGGRGCAFDERRGSVRRSRVVLTPRRWRQVGGCASIQTDRARYPAGDGDKKARSPGRARYKP